MPPIYGGMGDTETRDIASGQQSAYDPPAPQPYSYTVAPGVISGIDTATTFTGQEGRRVESYVTGVAREQAIFDANNPERTYRERIDYANQQTLQAITGTSQQALTGLTSFGSELLPIAAVAGAAILLLR